MRNAEIDAAVLAQTDRQWRKMAMIAAQVSEQLGADQEWALQQIAKRIRTLTRKGSLELLGEPYSLRHCEVRSARLTGCEADEPGEGL